MSGIQDRFNSVMKSFARKEKQPDTEVVADDTNDKESHFKRVKVSEHRFPRRKCPTVAGNASTLTPILRCVCS